MKTKTYNELKQKVDELEKKLNGGPGSGNFGHAGRPGKVGGSSKDSFSRPMRTKGFMEGDTVEITLDDGKKVQGEYKMSARVSSGVRLATIKGEDGEIYTVPFRSDRVKMIRNVDAPDTTPAQRRTKKQKEALSEVFGILNTDAKTQKYLLSNCGEDTAIALRDELKKAQEDGVDFSNVGLGRTNGGRNRAQVRTAIRGEYDGIRTNYKADVTLQLSSGLVAGGKNYEASLKKEYDKGEKNTDTIAAVFRHEIGHIRANNLVARLTNGNYNNYDYERVNRLVTDKALKATKLNFYDAGERVSQYALENRSEMLAESFAKPNKSNLTKAVIEAYNNFTQDDWGHTMNKVRKSEIIREFDLCTGVPIDELELDIIE